MVFTNQSKSFQYHLIDNKSVKIVRNNFIVEKPINFVVNAETWMTFMCTPIELDALAVGFLFNEGVIKSINQIKSITLCSSESVIEVWLDSQIEKPNLLQRSSGCFGNWTISSDTMITPPPSEGIWMSYNDVYRLISTLYESQKIYPITGGTHSSALSDGKKNIISCEDVGRHNTIDKIIGRSLLSGIILQKKVIITTGRISSEILLKAARFGIAIIISRTAPTSMSIELALEFGITLIGYARRSQFQIYTHPQRILF